MIDISFEYQPFSFLSYKRKFTGSFPASFEELSALQLIAVARFINLSISDTDFLHIMTSIKKFMINKIDDYQRYNLMLLFEPFTEIKPYHTFIIPQINTPFTILYSPKPKLAGVKFSQFIFADSYFTSYQNDKDPVDLHKFVASLYLPKPHRFSEDMITASAVMIANVKPEILDAIVINYVLIKDWLTLAYPMVFQNSPETEEPIPIKKQNNNSGWLKIFENIVGDDIINHDRYATLPFHNVLRWMTSKIKENLKRK